MSRHTIHEKWNCVYKRLFIIEYQYSGVANSFRNSRATNWGISAEVDSNKGSDSIIRWSAADPTDITINGSGIESLDSYLDGDGFSLWSRSNDSAPGSGTTKNLNLTAVIYYI